MEAGTRLEVGSDNTFYPKTTRNTSAVEQVGLICSEREHTGNMVSQ
jgi:hypothetical protein